MRAAVLKGPGGPEQLVVEDIDDPRPAPGEVRVGLRAASLNHIDIYLRQGRLPAAQPAVLGCEGAGEVAELGQGVTGLSQGDRVIVMPWVYGAEQARLPANLRMGILGSARPGTYAEQICVPADLVEPMWDDLSFEEAASIPLVTATAVHALVDRAHLGPVDDVLVLAASSGVGSMAVQLAGHLGARVIAATSPAKADQVRELGAGEVVNSRAPFAQAVRDLTGGGGVDVVVEQVGQATWEKSLASLARGGRLVTFGSTSGPDAALDIQRLYRDELSVIGSYGGTRGDLVTALNLVRLGRLRPIAHASFSLDQVARAHLELEKGDHVGKLVLQP